MNRTWKLFFALLIAAALLAVIPLALLRDTDFAGADGAAEEIVQELDPDYEPIDGEGCAILGKVTAVVRRY